MTNNCYCFRSNCGILSVFASVVIGVITTVLTITATIAVTPAFLWVLFGIAVLYLGVALIATALSRSSSTRECICSVLPIFLTGIFGTILTAVILLAITFAATSIIGAIITGLLLLFFTLIISATACIIRCIAGCDDEPCRFND